MYIHKYKIDEGTVYLISGDAKPAGTIQLKQKNWQKKLSIGGNVSNALDNIEQSFSGAAEEEAPVVQEAPKEEKEAAIRVVEAFSRDR